VQVPEEEDDRPIALILKKLNKLNYIVTEQECLADLKNSELIKA